MLGSLDTYRNGRKDVGERNAFRGPFDQSIVWSPISISNFVLIFGKFLNFRKSGYNLKAPQSLKQVQR